MNFFGIIYFNKLGSLTCPVSCMINKTRKLFDTTSAHLQPVVTDIFDIFSDFSTVHFVFM